MRALYIHTFTLVFFLTLDMGIAKAQLFKDAFYLSVGYGLIIDPATKGSAPFFETESSQTRPIIFSAELPISKAYSLGLLISHDKFNMSASSLGVSSEAMVKRYYFLFRGTYYTKCIGDSFCPYVGLDLGMRSMNSQFKGSTGGVGVADFGLNLGFGPAIGVHGGAKYFMDSFFIQLEVNPPIAYLHASVGYEF